MGERSPEVDAYIARQAEFARPILAHLRELFHRACPEIRETIKWGMPYFELEGLVGGIAGFKRHASLGFWKGALMRDPERLFDGVGSTQMSALKLRSPDDLPGDEVLIHYIQEAVELNRRGVKLPRPKGRPTTEVAVPALLAQALEDNPAARSAFEGFSPSQRREYTDWIGGAKQPATRQRRLEQALEWMAQGKPRNWRYMAQYREE